MRVELVVLVKNTPENVEQLQYLESPADWTPRLETDYLETRLLAHTEEAQDLLEELQSMGLVFYMREERHFELAEIRRAEVLKTCPETQILANHLPHEVQFDWSDACVQCMRSPEQVGPLVIEHRRLTNKEAVLGPRHELIVSEKVATRMIKDGISGCILRPVEDSPGGQADTGSFFQVIVTHHVAPAFCPPTRFVSTDDHCDACGQGGLFLDSSLYYDFGVEEFQDINHTFEVFGQGAGISPEILLSSRFYNLLLACGAQMAEPEPVLFV